MRPRTLSASSPRGMGYGKMRSSWISPSARAFAKLETVVVAMRSAFRGYLGRSMRRICLAVLCALLALPATASAVVGGRSAAQPYPYMVALEYDEPGGTTEYSFICGASLLAADRVL